jgi:hypothetical protein
MHIVIPNPTFSVFDGGCEGSGPRTAAASAGVTTAQTSMGPAARMVMVEIVMATAAKKAARRISID